MARKKKDDVKKWRADVKRMREVLFGNGVCVKPLLETTDTEEVTAQEKKDT